MTMISEDLAVKHRHVPSRKSMARWKVRTANIPFRLENTHVILLVNARLLKMITQQDQRREARVLFGFTIQPETSGDPVANCLCLLSFRMVPGIYSIQYNIC